MQTTTAEVQAHTGVGKTDWRRLLSPLVIALAALLALQLLAALVLELGGTDMVPAGSQGPLLTFVPEQVTTVRIESSDGEPVLVAKAENGWTLPSLGDLPAAEHKVTALLSKLEGLQKGLPVATSEEALKRFKVAEQAFERKLTLEGGDSPLAVLYLGDSPGFRRLFVRADGDSAVYEAELGLFDAPDKADDWSDRTLLHLDAEDLKQLTFPGVTLQRTEDGWQLADLAEGEEQDDQAIEDAVRALANVDFLGVLGEEEEPPVSQGNSPTEITATLASGDTIRYLVSKLAEGTDYLLEVSNRPQRFTLAAYASDDLTGLKRTDLLEEKTEDTTPTSTSASGSESPLEEAPPAPTVTDGAKEPAAQTPAAPPPQAQEAAGETGSEDAKPTESQGTARVPETPEGSNH